MATDPITTAPHQALYRRWRSQTFAQIVGQAAVVATLRNAVRLDRLSHGFLFVGPRGTGKTSMARILAKAVNCSDLQEGEPCDRCPACVSIREGRALDVVEMDAASNNRVDDMRELLPRVYTSAADLRRKVFIIDEVQRIKEGWDVLLKTLEEPPEGVLFIFCTTDPSQIRPAVVSRLQRYTFRPLTHAEIRGKLERILEAEGRTAEPAAIDLVAGLAAGGMRDAESMLDQVLGNADDPITAGSIRDLLGLADADQVHAFVNALTAGDALAGIAALDALDAEGRDLVGFAEQVVAALRERLVLALSGAEASGRSGPVELAAAARRLSGIDASRAGLGGYRWQLELALLAAAAASPPTIASAPPASARRNERPALVAAAPDPVVVEPAPTATPPAEPPRSEPSTPLGVPAEPAIVEPAGGAAAPGRAAALIAAVDPPAAEPDELLARLRAGWPDVVAFVARNPANKPLITACRPVEVRDGIVVLGFPEGQPFLREKAEQRRAALEEGLEHVLGRPVGVRCVITNVALLTPVETETADLVEHARRIFEEDLADVREIT